MAHRIELSEDRYKTAMLTILILTLFVQILDGTIVNVAIPTLADEFSVTDTQIDRAIIAYLVGLAVFIPTSGWLSDRFGSRVVFLNSLALFTAASVLCGLASTLPQLVIFRILQGVGAGVMGPLGSALLYRAFPQSERAKAATAVITVAVLAPAIGPVLGGAILEVTTWRWIFFVNVPIGAVAMLVGWLVIRDFRIDEVKRFDGRGFVLAGMALGGTLFGVTVARDLGWNSPVVIGTIGAGIAAAIALPRVERAREHPLLRFELFQAPIFRSIQFVAFPTYAAFLGAIFLLPVYLQTFRGFDPLTAGLVAAPQPLGVWIASQFVGRLLYGRVGPRRLMFGGLVGALIVGLALATVDETTSLWTLRVLMFLRGASLAFTFVSIQTAVYSQTSVADTAQATTLFSANRQAAPAFGIAAAAAVLSGLAVDPGNPQLGAYQVSFLVSALLFIPAIVAVWWVRDEDAAATMKRR